MLRLRVALLSAVAALACGRPAVAPPAPLSASSARAAPDTTHGDGVRNVVPGTPLTPGERRWVDSTLATLSLRDRVGQMVMVWLLGDYTSTRDSAFAEARRWVTDDRIGGVSVSLGSPIEVAAKLNALQRLARVPLLVSSDLEPGLGRLEGGVFSHYLLDAGSATVLPSNMAIGAGGDTAAAYAAGRVTGAEARAIGIHVAFAPTVDVNNNPANPVINTRSFGEDPRAVAALSAAFVRGVQEQGVAATAKHFPGHGDTDVDSHAGLPVVASTRARLDTVELVPFRAAIAAGVAVLMTAHIALPAVNGDSTPATLAPRIITGLIRDSLRFAGTTITDALTMEGVGRGYSVERSAVLAVQAGSDILLKPSDVTRAIDAVVAAVGRGEIGREAIERSARRVLELKARTGAAFHPVVDLDALRDVVGSPAHWRVADWIARDAITLLRDRNSLVPCTGRRVGLVEYVPESELRAGRAFVEELRAEGRTVMVARVTPHTGPDELDSIGRSLAGSACALIATYVRRIEGQGRVAIAGPVATWIGALTVRLPVIVVAFGNPYVIRQFPQAGSYLAAYGIGDALERAAARALVGRASIGGRAPVSLPGFFARGDGLRRAPATLAVAPSGYPRAGSGLADRRLAAALQDTIQELLDRGVADSAFPGAYAAVGDRDGHVVTAAAGSLDWRPSPRPDGRTLWDLASLTKVVGTTSALIQLVASGAVDLDAPVQRYLPEWVGAHKNEVTVRHLLSHSSGLPPWRPVYKEAASPADALAVVYATPLDTVPGVRMAYSDLGAILLGKIVERVSGEALDRYLAAHVFGPAGMHDTRYRPDPADRGRVAPTEFDPWRQRQLRGEVHDENAFALGGVAGHAGLFSTGDDLVRFARLYLHGGAADGVRVLDSLTLARFTLLQDGRLSNRALGWEKPTGDNSAGRLMSPAAVGHTGFTGTSLWIDPAHDVFVLVLTNRVNPTRTRIGVGRVRVAVADAALGLLGASPPPPATVPRQ